MIAKALAALLFIVLMLAPAAHAEPITAIITAIASISVFGTTVGAIVSAVSVVAGLASAAAGLLSSRKKPSLGNYSFADNAAARTQTVRSPIESHKIIYGRARVGGTLVYIETSAVNSSQPHGYVHMVVVLAAHEVEEIEEVYINDELATFSPGTVYVTNSRYVYRGTNYVIIAKHLGGANQTVDTNLKALVPKWDDDHRLRGHAYIYVRCRANQTMFTNGIPNFSAVVKGKKVYDPRTGLTGYSDNWALCMRDYISSTEYGLGAADSNIDDDTIIAAANVSDETVTLADGTTTQARYTCNGVVDTADKPIDILKGMTTAGAGVMVYAQGKYRLFAGAYDAPSVTINEDWLAGEIKVQTRPPRNDLFNAVKGVYIDPNKDWQPTDFPIVTNETYEEEDGGERITHDVELPFTINSEAAQRIGKITLEKGRQGIMIEIPCNLAAIQLSVWDTFYLDIAQLGWSSKIFRVLKWSIDAERGIIINAQEETAESYDWNGGEATTYDPAPDTSLPDATYVAPPGNPVIVEELYTTITSGGVKSAAIVTWDIGEETFTDQYVLQYQLTSAGDTWQTSGPYIVNNATIPDLEPGFYNFRVMTVNWRGQQSEWATTTKEIFGLTAPPEDISGFTLNAIHNQAHLKWEQATDIDVLVGGSIRVKWSNLTTGAEWNNGLSLGPDLPGISTNAVVPLLTGTYMIKAVDSGGRESVSATSISSNVANIVNMNAVVTSQQDNTFPGTKTNMVVDTGVLKLDGSTLFDDGAGNFDDALGLFDGGGTGSGSFSASGEYRFEDGLGNEYEDLGQVLLSRVTADIGFTVVDEASDFDSAGGDFDDRSGLFDGGDISSVDVKLYVRTTEDDPAGTPTWSAWREFVVGDYTARAYDFKLQVLSSITSNNIEIDTLRVNIDVPDREEHDEDVSTSAGGDTTITYAQPFLFTPNVAVTAQDLGTGEYVVISSKSATGFVINAKNSGGSRVARTFDWIARGY